MKNKKVKNTTSLEDKQKSGALFVEYCLAKELITEKDISSPLLLKKVLKVMRAPGTEKDFKEWIEQRENNLN